MLLEVKGLQAEYQTDSGRLRAVDDVSFSVRRGEVLALVGESGCGKSATALSLMRLSPADVSASSMALDGIELLDLSDKDMRAVRGKSIAMVFQDPMTSLNPSLTVGLQLTESLRLHLRLPRKAARRRAVDLLEMVGIPSAEDRLNDYPHQFSGGMRQRVMIAMALACEPKLLLADEITTALDVTIQAQVLELVQRLVRDLGTAVVFITHDLGVVAGLADRVNVMYAGQIVESATTHELFASPSMPYTWGLLQSVPRVDSEEKGRLVAIEGMPPDLTAPPVGCRFQARCNYSREICAELPPTLEPVNGPGDTHTTRCWGMQRVDGGGWLIGFDPRHAEMTQMEADDHGD